MEIVMSIIHESIQKRKGSHRTRYKRQRSEDLSHVIGEDVKNRELKDLLRDMLLNKI
jgi:hypothetical protein